MNILIASVGGQGGLTLSRVIALAAVGDGKSVRTGETLGMAQRFGSVVSYVRVGDEIHSPVFDPGDADVILGLELIEVSRNVHYLRRGGKIYTADEVKPPISSSLGIAENPKKSDLISRVSSKVKEIGGELYVIPAREIAVKAGNYRAMNMVLLGAFNASYSLLTDESVRKAIYQLLPGRKGDISVNAYMQGKSLNLKDYRKK
ncbi:MAG: indolepyruvate oxidoreductase subunit beta [Desulfurococcales archaeon]|nr:indolepyruvate oxidoreductase subunit beta [Desulfurococcales archaeon]